MIASGHLLSCVPYATSLLDHHCTDDGHDDNLMLSTMLSSCETAASSEFFRLSGSNKRNYGQQEAANMQEIWEIRKTEAGEEELYVKDNMVFWTVGNGRNLTKVIKTFTLDKPVTKAFWCRFQSDPDATRETSGSSRKIVPKDHPSIMNNELLTSKLNNVANTSRIAASAYNQLAKLKQPDKTSDDYVCLVDSTNLNIFNKNGDHFQLPLPFAVAQVYPIKLGLIIERATCDKVNSNLPILFSLMHPLLEVSPILMKISTSKMPQQESKFLQYCAPHNRFKLINCHEESLVCLMYNTSEKSHSLWSIRPTTNDEIDAVDNYYHRPSCSTTEQNMSSNSASFNHQSAYMSPMAASTSMRSMHSEIFSDSPSTLKFMSTPNRSRIIDYLRDDIGEPILPEIILEQIWSESSSNSNVISKSFYLTTDFVGQNYFAWQSDKRIKLVKFDNTNDGQKLVFGPTVPLPLKVFDSKPLNQLKMIIVVQMDHSVALYSGTTKIANVLVPQSSQVSTNFRPQTFQTPWAFSTHLSPASVLSSIQKRSSLVGNNSMTRSFEDKFFDINQTISPVLGAKLSRNFSSSSSVTTPSTNLDTDPESGLKFMSIKSIIGQSVMISPGAKDLVRFEIPNISTSSAVDKLLDSVRNVGSKDLVMDLFTKWYTTRNTAANLNLTADQELDLFKKWFLSNIQLNTDTIFNSSSSPRPDKNSKRLAQQPPQDVSSPKRLRPETRALSSSKCSFPLTSSPSATPASSKQITTDNKVSLLTTSESNFRSNQFFINLKSLFYTFHLVFEDFKLCKSTWGWAEQISDLLITIACVLDLPKYQEHYWRSFPYLRLRIGPFRDKLATIYSDHLHLIVQPNFFTSNPPSIYDHIAHCLRRQQDSSVAEVIPFPHIPKVTNDTRIVVSLFYLMQKGETISSHDLALRNIGNSYLNSSPDSKNDLTLTAKTTNQRVVALMDKYGVNREYILDLPDGIALILWNCIFKCRTSPPVDWPESCFSLIGRQDLVSLTRKYQSASTMPDLTNDNSLESAADANKSSNNLGNRTNSKSESKKSNNFNDEVIRLLFPDDERVSEAQRMLSSSSPVIISLPPRQGSNEDEIREEQQRYLYTLNIRTMALPVGRGMLTMRTYSPVIGESFNVPKLCLSGRTPPGERTIDGPTQDPALCQWPYFHNGVAAGLTICASISNNVIDSTWINYNRPKSSMNGQDPRDRESALSNTQNEHAGFLFALGLNGHLAKLSLMTIHDYLCLSNDYFLTKVAILLGLSAAKRGSQDNNMIKVLSIHVDALLPPTSTELDVPPSVQVASLLGVGLLYEKSGDCHLSKVLLDEIERPPGPETDNHVDRESYALTAGLAFGLVNLCRGSSSIGNDIMSADQLRHYMLGGRKKPMSIAQRERYKTPSCQIREGDFINTDVTSPGATLALGLMYHRSNNRSVAQWMLAPDTQYLLESIRPDLLILRMISYGLIMWSDIIPNRSWIESHIPKIVLDNAFQRSSNTVSPTIDFETMSQAYCNIVAGNCMAMGLKFAGSANRGAYKTVYKYTSMFIAMSEKNTLSEQAGRSTIETCLNVLVVSLSLIMAGTGNLEVLRVCRYLRSRVSLSCVFYGSHMAVHMSLGLLFLGGCRYSLNTSPSAIAALVCAFFPKFPTHSTDNRYHLQAFRHLYVLAAEPRLLIPRHIQTDQAVYVYLTLVLSDPNNTVTTTVTKRIKAPCLLPELDTIVSVCVDDDRYWRVEFDRNKNWSTLEKCLWDDDGCLRVKQKVGCLPYNEDEKGFKSMNAMSLMKDAIRGWTNQSSVLQFSSDQLVTAYSKYILNMNAKRLMRFETNLYDKLSATLFDCVANDKVELLPILTNIITVADSSYKHLQIQQLNLCNLIQLDLVTSIRSQLDDEIWQDSTLSYWTKYFNGEIDWTNTPDSVAHYMTMHDMFCCAFNCNNE